MYDELIKALRDCVEVLRLSLYKRRLMKQAADAIEEMSMKLHGDEAAIAGMKREIERMVVSGVPHWIPVTERLPEDDVAVLVTYVGVHSGKPQANMLAFRSGGVWWWLDNWRGGRPASNIECTAPVTHWMPLPEPPKEEE